MKRSSLIFVLAAIAAIPVGSVTSYGQRAVDPLRARVPPPQRQELERRFREQSADIVRRQLQLNNDQMSRLQAVNQQFEGQRLALLAEERQARQALRDELASSTPNQQKVATLLDQLMGVSRRRLDVIANEQRELAKFVTPVQRAKYLGLQNQLRQRMDEVRGRDAPRAKRRVPLMRPPGKKRDFR